MTPIKTEALKPPAIKKEIIDFLKCRSDQKLAESAQRFFTEPVQCYGVRAPEIRAFCREIYRRVKSIWSLEEALQLAESLLQEKEIEARSCGLLVLSYFNSELAPSDFKNFESWFKKGYLDNWALVDTFSLEVISPALLRNMSLMKNIEGWISNQNLYLRRAGLVSLIRLARNNQQTDLILRMVIKAARKKPVEDLVAKALGWLLRELGKRDSRLLENFLKKNGQKLPRVSVRYALERFTEEKRRYLLSITRNPR